MNEQDQYETNAQPATHAIKAAENLAALQRVMDQWRNMSQGDRIQSIASGAVAQRNKDMDYTLQLTIAHALTALALHFTRDG